MVIKFKTNKLEKEITDIKKCQKKFGIITKKIKQRIEELKSADNLSIIKKLPAPNCHELHGNFKGSLSVDVSGNYRLIFEPANEPKPIKDDGGLDWTKVNSIIIIDVIDYH